MSAIAVHCDIVSAEEEIYSGLVESVMVTGALGEMGVNYGHAPLLTSLIPGPVRVVKQGGEEEVFYVSGGFLEAQPYQIKILADTAIRADDIDEAAAEEAKKKAEQDFANQSADIDYSRALAEAAAQLRTIQELRKKIKK
ncbi:MAG: F0F1 ATP synthase subunit epsilon [Pseudomonadales bacterium]|nr:F0F1 ATP synthase subunit epsilon [Pseudomonadales bacterium]